MRSESTDERQLRGDPRHWRRPRTSRQHAAVPRLAPGSGVPDDPEQPRSRGRGAPRRAHRLRRHRPRRALVGRVRSHPRDAEPTQERRDAPSPVGEAGRGLSHARVGTPRAHRQRAHRPALGDVGRVPAHPRRHRSARSIGLVANAADVLPELVRRQVAVDVVTDQTSAHDPLDGYIPAGVGDPDTLRRDDPEEYKRRSRASISRHCEAIVALAKRGAIAFDYGNNLRGEAQSAGFANAFSYPGFVSEYIRPLFAQGRGPFRWVALSGDEADIRRTDKLVLELFSENRTLSRWIRLAGERVPFQGLPARVCWLGYGERAEFGLRINDLVASGELKAPIVIGRDHLDAGSVASPFRETEGMRDGSDAIADWPILNALLNTASGAAWVSFHHGGGTGIGNSLHAGQVSVAAGTPPAAPPSSAGPPTPPAPRTAP